MKRMHVGGMVWNGLYYHIRFIALAIIGLGVLCAGFVAYVFLYIDPVPDDEGVLPIARTFSIHREKIQNVELYLSSKNKSARTLPVIRKAVFFQPPKLP